MPGADDATALIEGLPPSRANRRLAILAIGLSFAALVVMVPFARVPLAPIPAFIPAYEAALATNNLITAVLLYTQGVRTGRRSVLFAASGFLFSVIVIVAHALSFPGVFAPAGVLGGGSQTTAWLYSFWHLGFPLAILGYAALAGSRLDIVSPSRRATALAIAVSGATMLGLGSIALSMLGDTHLPIVVIRGDYSRMVSLGISPTIMVVTALGIASLWRQRRRSVLALWLFAVLCVWTADVALSAVIGSARYDLGWYGGRLFGLLATVFVMTSLLVEANKLYARLASSLTLAEQRNTELIQSRSELARVQRMDAVGQLTAGVAHDFNNILTAILGGLEMIGRRPENLPRVRLLADNATKAALRGARLVSQLMTFARQQNLKPEIVDLNTLLREFESLGVHAISPAVRLVFELDPGAPAIQVDTMEFQAALLNLVSNARDASPAQGLVTITSRFAATVPPELPAGPYAQIRVTDAGPGMSAETQAKAFEPFYTTKAVGAGTGLGLSQVHGFVHSAGGAITINSSPVGTVVDMFLPLVSAADGVRA